MRPETHQARIQEHNTFFSQQEESEKSTQGYFHAVGITSTSYLIKNRK